MRQPGFLQFDQETYLARRLREMGTGGVFTGATDTNVRRERFRSAIISNNLADVVVGNIGGKPENFSQLFARIYGEPLKTLRGIYDANAG